MRQREREFEAERDIDKESKTLCQSILAGFESFVVNINFSFASKYQHITLEASLRSQLGT